MRIQWAFACRNVDLIEGGGLANVQGIGIDAFFVPSLPVDLTFMALARLATPVADAGIPSDFEVDLYGPEMSVAESLEFQVNFGQPNPQHPEGWEMTMLVPIVVQFTGLARAVRRRVPDRREAPAGPALDLCAP